MKKAKNNNHYSRPILHVYGYPAPTTNEIITFVCFLLLLPANPNYAAAQHFNDTSTQIPPNPFGNNSSFKPSMGVTIAVLIGAFIFMGFFSIYIRQCSQTQSDGSVRQTFGRGRSRRAVRGLDPAVIETFPTFIYSVVKGLKIGKGTLECAVCLNEFEDDETLRLLPKCDHVFHPECIDAWLSSHTTCPVCRANLIPVPGEETSIIAIAQPPDSDIRSQNEIVLSEVNDLQHQVSVRVIEDQNKDSQVPDVINPTQIPIQNRPVRSRSTRPRIFGRFPRSHSTGHSLVQPGENCERFTLKLPEEVRKKIVESKLNRTTSCVTLPTGQGSVSRWSSRRGYRNGGEGSSRGKNYQFERLDGAAKSDRWMFSMAPPFLWRTSSVRSPKKTEGSVKSPFDCIGAKPDDGEPSSSARPPV